MAKNVHFSMFWLEAYYNIIQYSIISICVLVFVSLISLRKKWSYLQKLTLHNIVKIDIPVSILTLLIFFESHSTYFRKAMLRFFHTVLKKNKINNNLGCLVTKIQSFFLIFLCFIWLKTVRWIKLGRYARWKSQLPFFFQKFSVPAAKDFLHAWILVRRFS